MLKLNCQVVCVDINKLQLDKLEQELNLDLNSKRVHFLEADLSCTKEIENLVVKVKDKVSSVDILINNAGIMNKAKLLTDLSEKEIVNIFNVNILSQFLLCKAFLPGMIRKNSGHIVNISSSLGVYGTYKLTDYCSTKFAVNGFSEALRVELKTLEKDIKVTIVCPFHVKTPLFNGFNLPTLKWLSTSVTPEFVAEQVREGILLDKEIVGCPKTMLWFFSAIK